LSAFGKCAGDIWSKKAPNTGGEFFSLPFWACVKNKSPSPKGLFSLALLVFIVVKLCKDILHIKGGVCYGEGITRQGSTRGEAMEGLLPGAGI
jgi:hypothetical protein